LAGSVPGLSVFLQSRSRASSYHRFRVMAGSFKHDLTSCVGLKETQFVLE